MLAAGLGGGGLAVHLSVLRRERDADLVREATRAARGPGPRPRGGPPPGFDFRPPRPDGPPDAFGRVRRLAEIRRPRFFDPSGISREPGPVPFPPIPGFSDGTLDGERIRVFTRVDDRGRVQVARETRELDLATAAAWRTLLFGLPVAVLLGGLVGAGLTRRALGPVERLAKAAGRIEPGAGRFPAEGDDEFARLSASLNGLLDRLDEAAARERRFVADVAHELRTPLARIRAVAGSGGDPAAALASVDRSAGDLARLTDTLLLLARADAGRLVAGMETLDLRVVVAEALPDDPRVRLRAPDRPVPLKGHADLLGRAVANLVENALRHGGENVAVTVDTTGIVVEDDGPGVPAELVPRLGERFFRADAARSGPGSGLGLALVGEIARAHGATFTAGNRSGGGFRAAIHT